MAWLLLVAFLPSLQGWGQSTAAEGAKAQVAAETPADGHGKVLARAQSAELERRYAEAIRILRAALVHDPGDTGLQLELGRAYLATGQDAKAQRLLREILKREPDHRAAQLELGRTLAYRQRYDDSDEIYRHLLAVNPADEAAAIGLTSNLMHEGRPDQASTVATAALVHHPNSLRLMEFKDRIAKGLLGGNERAVPAPANSFTTSVDFIDDSAGNHSWRGTESLQLRLRPGLTSELNLEQLFQHSLDDPLEVMETFSEALRWKPVERLAVTAGGGAARFDDGDVRATYEATLTGLLAPHVLAGATFSRILIAPDAEAAEHELTAQGWETFGAWTPDHWQINVRGSRRHYTDGNVSNQEWAEALHQWRTPKVVYTAGYRYRHYGFSMDAARGYFSPDNYQSHQAVVSAAFRPNRHYRGEWTARLGAESIASGVDFQSAWELSTRQHLTLGHWDVGLDYSHYHMAQATGAFRADAARFEFAYHF